MERKEIKITKKRKGERRQESRGIKRLKKESEVIRRETKGWKDVELREE